MLGIILVPATVIIHSSTSLRRTDTSGGKEHRKSCSSRPGSLVHPKYRGDIDGLRAIAVLSVVGFHAFPNWIKSGFVGVDVFFVISGFLISTIIFSSLERGVFSFAGFYGRRIRRIFPALLVVLIACYVFGWFALLADEYRQLGKHIAAGAGFASNFALWNESGYFDAAAETKPLLHLWSLGIEEQFYIGWPLALWAAWKKRLNFMAVTLSIACLSFVINLAKFRSDGVADFYSPQTRFWELLAGSTLAYILLHKNPSLPGHKTPLRDLLTVLGGLFIIASIFLVASGDHFPGAWALLPVSGTMMVIAAGQDAWLNRVVLSHPIMVWFGLISFPLYLWHWPLLTFAHIVESAIPSRFVRIAAVLMSIAIAWVTYRFLEKPLRSGSNGKIKTICLVILMLSIGATGYVTYKRDGLGFRLGHAKRIHPLPTRMQLDNYEELDITKSIWGSVALIKSRDFLTYKAGARQEPTVAVVGDSHANRLYLGLQNESDFSLLNIGRGTCPPFIDVDVLDQNSASRSCQPLTNNYLTYIRANNAINVVVLNAFYRQLNNPDVKLISAGKPIEAAEAMARTIEFLADSGKTIVVAMDVPEINPACYEKRSIPVWKTRVHGSNLCVTPKAVEAEADGAIKNTVFDLSKKSKRICLYDPGDVLCRDGFCGEISKEDYLFDPDGNHLNEFGVNIVGQDLSRTIDQCLRTR